MFSPASHDTPIPSPYSDRRETSALTKEPRLLLQNPDDHDRSSLFAFPPNRDTLGGTAYFIVEADNILVDSPAWNDANRTFLEAQGGVAWLVLTHRGSIGKALEIQQAFGCQILIQEQEAYLLPGVTVTTFEQTFTLTPESRLLWTPGHSPGSACLYHSRFGGVLFSGRHLLPNPQGHLLPLRTSKTFHWRRQLQSLQTLLAQFTPETLHLICPGANTGFLRGRYLVENAYQALAAIDQHAL